jgi:PKD repeat protein
VHPAPDGRLFVSGPDAPSRYLNPSGGGEWIQGPRSRLTYRDYGSSVMYAPGKILIVGGGDPPTNTAETIDLNTGGAWQSTGSMAVARRQMTATVLPNGDVLALGGSSGTGFNNEARWALAAESWNPSTGAWTTLASMATGRGYHSSAVLLPDGRVLMGGGGRCAGCVAQNLNAELFSPPYLFAADGTPAVRPTISSAPTSVAHGETFTVGTPSGAAVAKVSWVRLPSVTHSYNQNQGFNQLTFTTTTGGLRVTAPSDAYRAPPGHYMLFILDANGVPSVAKIVQLRGTGALPGAPGTPAAPTGAAASAPNRQQINVTWADKSTSEITFHVERCTGATCTSFAEVGQVGPDVTLYRDLGLTERTTYSYRVRAKNLAGFSGYSNTVTTTTPAEGGGNSITSGASGRCVDLTGGSQALGTLVIINDCGGALSQQWTAPAVGVAGEIKVFGYLCLDAKDISSADNTPLQIWECGGGGPNQRWTRNAAGEIRGIGGKCVDVRDRALTNGSGLVLMTCNGSATQKWNVQAPAVDAPPVARFTFGCSGLSCTFNSDGSTDDQAIASRAWNFGDGTTVGNIVAPLKGYAVAGTYAVTLTITDVAGQTGTQTLSVSVTSPSTPTPPQPDGTIASIAAARCVDLAGGSQSFGTRAVITDCGSAVGQQWTAPAVDVPGELRVAGKALCLDATDFSSADGTPLQIWGCGGGPNQRWTRNAAGEIRGLGGKCVDLRSGAIASGSGLVLMTCNGSATQKWNVKGVTPPAAPPQPDGTIASGASGRCMDLAGGSQTWGTRVMISDCVSDAATQRWTAPAVGVAGQVRVNGTVCLDATDFSSADGTPLQIWECGGGPNQRGTRNAAGEIRGLGDKCVDVFNGGITNGSRLILMTCNGSATQKWNVKPPSTPPAPPQPVGTIANGASGRCADLTGASLAWGTRAVINDCTTGKASQRWTAPAVGVAGQVRVNCTVCLDATDFSSADGTPLQIWECGGGPNQQWTRNAAGEIRGLGGKCVDVDQRGLTNGSGLILMTCDASPTQKWVVK